MHYRILFVFGHSNAVQHTQALMTLRWGSTQTHVIVTQSVESAEKHLVSQQIDLLIGFVEPQSRLVRLIEQVKRRDDNVRVVLITPPNLNDFDRLHAELTADRMLPETTTSEQLCQAVSEIYINHFAPVGPPRPAAKHRAPLLLSAEQQQELQSVLAQVGHEVGMRSGLLVDLSGQEIVHWSSAQLTDIGSVAALAAGDMMATIELGRLVGNAETCKIIVQGVQRAHDLDGAGWRTAVVTAGHRAGRPARLEPDGASPVQRAGCSKLLSGQPQQFSQCCPLALRAC